MNYEEALAYLSSPEKLRFDLGLARMGKILGQLGNPHHTLKAIHVAGTNGKGSVCAFVAQALQDAGYKVGLFISPGLTDFRERIQINREWIPEEDVVEISEKLKEITDNMQEQPPYFEIMTAMAFEYFFKQECDYVVLEVGMGGRLDATNVCRPVVTAITNISLDHTKHLGETIEEIRLEKEGIKKENVPHIEGEKTEPYEGEVSLKGEFQKKNAGVAYAILKQLALGISDEQIRESFKKTRWHGRMQKIGNVLLDCAHNVAGFRVLAEELRKMGYDKLISVFAISIEKDLKGIFEILNPLADKIIVTKTSNYRAESPERIAEFAKDPNIKPG
ncbi:MAG: folylpolyglutamate synthase/dihydrofolate synthase family protein, partial [archaeon]